MFPIDRSHGSIFHRHADLLKQSFDKFDIVRFFINHDETKPSYLSQVQSQLFFPIFDKVLDYLRKGSIGRVVAVAATSPPQLSVWRGILQ